MTDSYFEALMRRCGLVIETKLGYAVLGGRLGKMLGFELASRIEGRLAGSAFAGLFGTCAIYVAKRADA
jgi:hypothetical protein